MELLFTYGSLQLESVQKDIFGKILKGSPQQISQYKLEKTVVGKEKIASISGRVNHPIAVYTGNNKDIIDGMAYEISSEELNNLDPDKTSPYRRIKVTLISGQDCWVYVF